MKHYIDLVEALPAFDKEVIKNYITTYGVRKENFMGTDQWLQNWSHANQNLYKLLGQQFILKVSFTYQKSGIELRTLIEDKLLKLPFIKSYNNFLKNVINKYHEDGIIDGKTVFGFSDLIDIDNFMSNNIVIPIKMKKPGANKIIQVSSGTKIMKAFSKVVEYFKDDFQFEDFEEFRIAHSIMLTDKEVKGSMVFSIHPMDFLTMSDNDSNWSSCMSWRYNGCYHVGTIEMMNSNNTICCYLENSNPFVFGSDAEDGSIDAYTWNNKKWRVLGYITKDIIMSGKAYPFINDKFSIFIVNTLKELAKNNLGWSYKFGPELYQDMKYINSLYTMNRARDYVSMRPIKKNILWDTKGMYNDMLNAKINYWCCRNAVKKTKIISTSGKAICCSCGGNILGVYDDYTEDYNERYSDVHRIVCEDCYTEQVVFCECCNEDSVVSKLYEVINSEGNIKQICTKCYKNHVRVCPCCGETFFAEDYAIADNNKLYYCFESDLLKKEFKLTMHPVIPFTKFYVYNGISYSYEGNTNIPEIIPVRYSLEQIYVCNKCLDTIKKQAISVTTSHFSWNPKTSDPIIETKNFLMDPKFEKYRFKYLDTPKGDPLFMT